RGRTLAALDVRQRCGQLGATCKREGTFAGLDLDELTGQLEALGLGEPGNGLALRFQSEAGATLAGGRHANVGDNSSDGHGRRRPFVTPTRVSFTPLRATGQFRA